MAVIADLVDITYSDTVVVDGDISGADFWNTDILKALKDSINLANAVITDELGTNTTSGIKFRITTNEYDISILQTLVGRGVAGSFATQLQVIAGTDTLYPVNSYGAAVKANLSGAAFTGNISTSSGKSLTMGGDIVMATNDISGGGTATFTTFSGALTGNSSTATALATARAINGVDFDGTAAITVTAAAGTLTGTTLKSTVVTSSLTTVGALNSGSISTSFGTINTGGRVMSDDTTDATSTTDGSLQTDGGLSVAKKGYFGDDIRMAAGKGISFSPYTPAGVITSQTLTDFEEGTWVPTDSGTATWDGNEVGTYTKIGRLVTLSFYIKVSGAGTGTIVIGGIPFTPAATISVCCGLRENALTGAIWSCRLAPGGSTIALYDAAGATTAANSSGYDAQITYEI